MNGKIAAGAKLKGGGARLAVQTTAQIDTIAQGTKIACFASVSQKFQFRKEAEASNSPSRGNKSPAICAVGRVSIPLKINGDYLEALIRTRE